MKSYIDYCTQYFTKAQDVGAVFWKFLLFPCFFLTRLLQYSKIVDKQEASPMNNLRLKHTLACQLCLYVPPLLLVVAGFVLLALW